MTSAVGGTATLDGPHARIDAFTAVWATIVAAALVAGVGLRAWILAGPLGTVESDEAIVGLMASEALEGTFHVFYWVNYYSGTQEALLTAVLFAIAGPSVVALKLVPIALVAAAAVVTWRVGVLTVGERAARVGAALMWVWPGFAVFWSTKARSAYGVGLLCGVVALWMVVRLRDRQDRRDAIVLGLALGCGVWSTQQSLLMAIPALAWLAWRRPGAFRLAPWAVLGGAVGGAPWLVWNVTHDFKGVLPVSSAAGEASTFAGRFSDLFAVVLPEWLGLRLPYSLDWLGPRPLGAALTTAAVLAFVVLLVRRPPHLEPLLFVLSVFPFLYAATSFTYFTDEPRYLTFVAPVPALLLGRLLVRPALAAAGLAAATLLSALYLVEMEDQGRFRYLGQPDDIAPLVSLLEREGENRVFADYWIAYRLVFESDRRIVATSTGFVRNAEYDATVRADASPAYVYVEGSAADAAAGRRLNGHRRVTTGGWAVYLR